jgi:hypothetical protein
VAAKKAVKAPITATIESVAGDSSKSEEHLMIKKTPAVTSVAAWIKADTGVGPSIASGNQMCKPTCADFPKAPQNSKKVIMVNLSTSRNKNEKELLWARPAREKTVQ